MSDNAYGSPVGGGQEDGTSNASMENVSSPQGSQPKGQEQTSNEQPITQQYLKEMEQRIIEEATRRAQSMTDKMGSRLDKEIQGALDQASMAIELGKQSGIKYTPEQEQAIRDRAINSAYAKMNQESQSQTPGSEPQGQDQGQQPKADPAWGWVNQKIVDLMGETGVFITSKEANKLILGDNNENRVDPYEYLKAFEGLVRQRQQNNQSQGLNPAIPSYVTGGRSSSSQSALRQAYDKEIAQIAKGTHPTIVRGDITGRQNLDIAYRRKGLDI
jgi:hypothetical protein